MTIPTLIIAALVAAPALGLAATFLPWGREKADGGSGFIDSHKGCSAA